MMGVNIVSNISANSGKATNGAVTDNKGDIPIEFSSLLAAQRTGSEVSPATSLLVSSSFDKIEKQEPSDGSTLADTTNLAAILGIPQLLTPAIQQTVGGSLDDKHAQEISIDNASRKESGVTASSLMQQENLNKTSVATSSMDIKASLAEQKANFDAANIAADASKNTSAGTNSSLIAVNTQSANTHLQAEPLSQRQVLIDTPIGNKAWPEQLGNKIVWLAKNDQQSAQININPPQLGPIQITLNLHGDQANALFASPHAEVRQAIETALPHLREMLSSAGITLGDANVGANLSQQNPNPSYMPPNRNPSAHENAILPANETLVSTGISRAQQTGRGLVDLFA